MKILTRIKTNYSMPLTNIPKINEIIEVTLPKNNSKRL
jgi:hypothetical protein